MFIRRFGLLPIVLCCLLTACGGGGGGDSAGGEIGGNPSNPPSTPVAAPSFVKLSSETGDFIGEGQKYSYSQADAVINVTAQGSLLIVEVRGDDSWVGYFQLPNGYTNLASGTFNGLTRHGFHDPVIGGLSWSGNGRGCNTLTGSFTLKKVVYEGNSLSEIDLQFTQHCEGVSFALQGDIYWNAKDKTSPPGPAAPPSGLWRPAAGITPASGNFVYLDSEANDFVGEGRTYLYTPADALFSVDATNARLTIEVNGYEQWAGEFAAMNTLGRLEPGYYGDLQRYAALNPAKGGLDWYGDGRGCNRLTGWFVVDSVTYSGSTLTAIDLRFEQHCDDVLPADDVGPALRGQIHWNASDSTPVAGPVAPPPGLWQPAAGVTPATGNYVYIESQPGDFIGQGQSHLYTEADAILAAVAIGTSLSTTVVGDQRWGGSFKPMNSLSRLEVGYYDHPHLGSVQSPVRGGFHWSGESRSCNSVTGWFVVDSVTYSGATVAAVDLRFEQHCEGAAAALRGKIHWDSNDSTSPPGPVPPPVGTWQPSPGVVPTTGNYVYLESQPGDSIGGGRNYLHTSADSVLTAQATGGRLIIGVTGDLEWGGGFEVMSSLSRLELGYYGDVQNFSFHNPLRGGLVWVGEGRNCSTVSGWFVVDDVVYSGTTLMSIDLRFEQHCEGGAPALRGSIHWDASDTTTPPTPGPVTPPADAWQPAPGVTPATGNYIYLESQPGEFIGQGHNYLYTQANAVISLNAPDAHLAVSIRGDQSWQGDFAAMDALNRLEVGYYGNLQRYPFHNTVKGGLNWSGESRGCNVLTGWFAVDNVTYVGTTLTAIDLRFEQHCEGDGPALRGKIHWDTSVSATPPGPIAPPANLWQPPPGATPASGNYVYLSSQALDFIGQGKTYLYTMPGNPSFAISSDGAFMHVTIGSGAGDWNGDFLAMNSLSRLEVGYYGDLQRYPFGNPTKGALNWSGQGRGCSTVTGWFVVDSVIYAGSTLMSIDLRFEQHCEGGTDALRGKIHWSQ